MSNPSPSLSALSSSIADAVEAAAPFVVGVRTGRRRATGIAVGGGEVVTTAHALSHSGGAVGIQLADGSIVPAEVVGRDPATDLALLRIKTATTEADAADGDDEAADGDGDDEATETDDAPAGLLPDAAPWAEIGAARVGHLVLTLGRPGESVRSSLGLVSGLGGAWRTRRGGSIDAYLDVDGSLLPGFSGGPLIAADGGFLGLNTSRVVPGGTTIPAATVTRVVEAIRERGDLKPGWLGIVIQSTELPTETAEDVGATHGLLVTGVAQGSPAAEAGVRSGDVLLRIDGQNTSAFADLATALAGRSGEELTLDVLRHGTRTELVATIGERRRRAC